LDVGMTVASEPPPAGDFAAVITRSSPDLHAVSIFEPLTSRELDLLIAVISAGWRMVSAVHPLLCPLWHDPGRLAAPLANGCAR
jgi:hypothetical protein